MGLKWQLDARSKTHQATSLTTKCKRQEASSNYPFAYLSPASKKAKIENLKKALATAKTAAADVIERVPVNDIQNDDITDLVHSIHSSEEDQRELERIFAEADETGEGCGETAKQIWEADVTDMEQFFQDQKKSGKLTYTYSLYMHVV